MKTILAMTIFLGGLVHAHADTYQKCTSHEDQEVVIGACTDIIESDVRKDFVAMAHFYRANSYYYLGRYENAVKDYVAVTQISDSADLDDWQKSDLYYNTGRARQKLGQWHDALDDFLQSSMYLPENGDSFYRRGETFETLGDNKRAINEYCIAASSLFATSEAIDALKRLGIE